MSNSIYTSKSGELRYELIPGNSIIEGYYGNLKNVSTDEYIEYIKRIGETMNSYGIGRILLDFSKMSNFGITLRAAAVNNINPLVLSKAPFFLLAIVKSNSAFENLATATAMNSAKSLSKKFVDGKLFDNRADAEQWLSDYRVSADLEKGIR